MPAPHRLPSPPCTRCCPHDAHQVRPLKGQAVRGQVVTSGEPADRVWAPRAQRSNGGLRFQPDILFLHCRHLGTGFELLAYDEC
jgi:hypothetical protein